MRNRENEEELPVFSSILQPSEKKISTYSHIPTRKISLHPKRQQESLSTRAPSSSTVGDSETRCSQASIGAASVGSKSFADWKASKLNLNMIDDGQPGFRSSTARALDVIMEESIKQTSVKEANVNTTGELHVDGWYYTDLSREKQGPFGTERMLQWFSNGFFPMECWVKPPEAWMTSYPFSDAVRSVMSRHGGYAPICLLFPKSEAGKPFEMKSCKEFSNKQS
jgi:hypothetical protein